jgi:hypothetical protein
MSSKYSDLCTSSRFALDYEQPFPGAVSLVTKHISGIIIGAGLHKMRPIHPTPPTPAFPPHPWLSTCDVLPQPSQTDLRHSQLRKKPTCPPPQSLATLPTNPTRNKQCLPPSPTSHHHKA